VKASYVGKAPVSYTFRIRFDHSPFETILSEASEIKLPTSDAGVSLCLRTTSGNSLKDDEAWALVGEGYASEENARAAGTRALDTLMVTFTRLLLGADFGNQVPIRGQFTAEGLRRAEELLNEERLLDDFYGLSVFLSDPRPKFVRQPLAVFICKDPGKFQHTFLSALAKWRPLTRRQRMPFILFLLSHFEHASFSRFLIQMMAVEALIKTARKPRETIAFIDLLIDKARNSSLAEQEKTSLINGIGTLKTQSITDAGQQLANSILGDRSYDDKSAGEFFRFAYGLRSRLVHGNISAFIDLTRISGSSRPEIPMRAPSRVLDAAPMELFVSDLLTVPLLGQSG
jgi:hypothetical protein